MFSRTAVKKYYGALEFLARMINDSKSLEITTYILHASLYGDYQNPNPNVLRYPKDILIQLGVWLNQRGFNAANIADFYEVIDTVDEFFELNFGCDLISIFKKDSEMNEEFHDESLKMIDDFERRIGQECERARLALKVFENFCDVRQGFEQYAIVDSLPFCSQQYIVD